MNLLINFFSIPILWPILSAALIQDSQFGISLSYPDPEWVKVEIPTASASVDQKMKEQTLLTIQKAKADDGYHARFSVVTDSATPFKKKDKSLAESYEAHAIDFLKSQRFTILSQERKKLPNAPTTGLEVVAHQRDFGLTFRQHILLQGERAYLLTAASRSQQSKEYQPQWDQFFNGVKWK